MHALINHFVGTANRRIEIMCRSISVVHRNVEMKNANHDVCVSLCISKMTGTLYVHSGSSVKYKIKIGQVGHAIQKHIPTILSLKTYSLFNHM